MYMVQQFGRYGKKNRSTKGAIIWRLEQDRYRPYFYTLIYEDKTNVYNS